MNFHVSAVRGQDCRDFARVLRVDHPIDGGEAAFIADLYTIIAAGSSKDKLRFWINSRAVAKGIRKRLKWPDRSATAKKPKSLSRRRSK